MLKLLGENYYLDVNELERQVKITDVVEITSGTMIPKIEIQASGRIFSYVCGTTYFTEKSQGKKYYNSQLKSTIASVSDFCTRKRDRKGDMKTVPNADLPLIKEVWVVVWHKRNIR